jgi:HEAT repeat protein
MLRQAVLTSTLLVLAFAGFANGQSQATRVYTRADFINVDGANLNEKIERAAQMFKATRQGDSVWLAYHIPVHENARFGQNSGWIYYDGDGIRLEKRDDPAGAAIFLLTDTSGAKPVFLRAKTLNITEPYKFENRPVYWLGDIEAGQSVAFLETLVRAGLSQTSDKANERILSRSALRIISYHNSPRAVPLLEEMAQKETHPDLQRTAISSLGQIATNQSLDVLDKLFNSFSTSTTTTLKREIVRAYGYASERSTERRALDKLTAIAKSNDMTDVRAEAIRRIASFGSRNDAAADRLFEIYDSLNDVNLQREIIQHVSTNEGRNEKVFRRLVAIAKTGSTPELQRAAVRRLSIGKEDERLNLLIELYDTSNVEAVKEEVIMSLARSDSRKAADKLLKIAKDDPSPKLRQAAIRRLSSRSVSIVAPGDFNFVWRNEGEEK